MKIAEMNVDSERKMELHKIRENRRRKTNEMIVDFVYALVACGVGAVTIGAIAAMIGN
jgi:hypothetical protein